MHGILGFLASASVFAVKGPVTVHTPGLSLITLPFSALLVFVLRLTGEKKIQLFLKNNVMLAFSFKIGVASWLGFTVFILLLYDEYTAESNYHSILN